MTVAVISGVLTGAFVLALMSVKASIVVARRSNAMDFPDGKRKTQTTPIPRLGGVGVAVAFTLVASLAVFFLDAVAWPSVAGIVVPALLVALLGFVDDIRAVNPWLRLLAQALCAVIAWTLGTQLSITGVSWLDFLIFVAWVVLIVNGMNLLDNSDGLAASTAFVAAAGATVIAFLSGQEVVTLLGASVVGVTLGFLWHNWFPARVYLGDAGAYFLGFLLAVLVVRLRPEQMSAGTAAMAAIALLALPIGDTAFVVVRRIRLGIHPFTPGRDHLSHQLQVRGLSTPHSVVALQGLSVTGAVFAVSLVAVLG